MSNVWIIDLDQIYLLMFPLSCILYACMLYYCNMVRSAWWDWELSVLLITLLHALTLLAGSSEL